MLDIQSAIKDQESVVAEAEEELKGVKEEAKVGQRTTGDIITSMTEYYNARIGLALLKSKEQIFSEYKYLSDLESANTKEEFTAETTDMRSFKEALDELLKETNDRFTVAEVKRSIDEVSLKTSNLLSRLQAAPSVKDVIRKRGNPLSDLTAEQKIFVGAGLIAFVWALVVLLLYWRNPGRLVKWLEALPDPVATKEATSVVDKVTFGSYAVLNLVVRTSLLFLGTSPRALEAWVAQRRDFASSVFNSKPAVRDRRIALDLPVRIEGTRYAEPWSELERLLSKKTPVAMLICGPGGGGKTTLACQIARRALGTDDQLRLGASPMLPLFVEADVTEEAGKPDGFYLYLAGLLRGAVNEGRPISVTLTRSLLRSGRVLVIVDGMSERSDTTRSVFNPGNFGFDIRRLIVTSREHELPGMTVVVETETIPTGALFDFIARYLQEAEKNGGRAPPSEDRILDACGDLKRLLGDTPCTPLLAAMWAMEIGAAPQTGSSLPRGVAGLMDSYVRRVLLPAANGNEALVDRLTKDATKLAERELGEGYLPGSLTRATALEVMRTLDTSDPAKRFAVLERSRLLEASSQYSDAVRISPDPVAEHLVARLHAEECGSDGQRWRAFLKRDLPGGFVAALAACTDHEAYGTPVPQLIRQRIKQIRDNRSEPKAVA